MTRVAWPAASVTRSARVGCALALCVTLVAVAAAERAGAAPAGNAELFPKPPALEAPVKFWKRVYTEINGSQGFLHDAQDLSIVYDTISVPSSLSRRVRQRLVNKKRQVIEKDLRLLGAGRRTRLTSEQQRLLRLFPRGVSNRRLVRASHAVRFQRGQADKFFAGLKRQGRWQKYMREVFEERGLPVALTVLPHVESSFNPKAISSVGASGLWQFTRSTGRRYLRIDRARDERNDPWLATVAAAKLLEHNYQTTKSWPLAITAYNHGVGGMRRAIRRLGTREISTVLAKYKSRTFGFASRNFYCSFLAALEIDNDPHAYFGAFTREPVHDPERVKLAHYYRPAALARALDVSVTELRRENPALRSAVWNGHKYVPRNYELRVPRARGRADAATLLARVPSGERFARQLTDTRYRVRHGDTMSAIARRFRVSQRELVALNGLRNAHRIRVGQVLTLPTTARRARQPLPAGGVYRVRRGETLDAIAQRFGLRARELAAWNKIANPNLLRVGQKLALRAPGAATVTARAGVYTVQRGDTIEGIARNLGVQPEKILALNRIRNRHRIYPGSAFECAAQVTARVNGGGIGRSAARALLRATAFRRPSTCVRELRARRAWRFCFRATARSEELRECVARTLRGRSPLRARHRLPDVLQVDAQRALAAGGFCGDVFSATGRGN